MATLDPGKLELIAQYLNSFPAPGKGPIGGQQEQAAKDAFTQITGTQLKTDGDIVPVGPNSKWDAYYNETLVENGLAPIAHEGEAGLFLINRLVAFVGAGILTDDEATAYLNSKYGVGPTNDGYNFAWVPVFGVGPGSPSEVVEQQIGAATDGLTETETPSVKDLIADAKANIAPESAEVAQAPYLYEPQISDDAEPGEIASELQQMHESLLDALGEIKAGLGNVYPPNSIHGSAIKPGTLAASKLASGALFDSVSQFPQPDEAVTLQLAESSTTDRWLSTTVSGVTYQGPGRVQNVVGIEIPKVFRPDKGLVRYRILTPGVRLTVLSIVTEGPVSISSGGIVSAPTFLVQYGFVISGIPNFLGPGLREIVAAPFVGDSPSSLELARPFGNGRLFEEWANDAFEPDTRSLFTELAPAALAGTSGYYPTKPSWVGGSGNASFYTRLIEGFCFNLVSGRKQDEVYAELNGRGVPSFAHIGGNPSGPRASAPPGIVGLPPCPASAAEMLTPSPDALYAPGSSSTYASGGAGQFATGRAITGADPVMWGVPFLGEDCHRLRQTDESFSLVVQLWPPKRITPGQGALEALVSGSEGLRPATWGSIGLEIDPGEDREIAVDIVVA